MEEKPQQDTAQIETAPKKEIPFTPETSEETERKWFKPLIFSVLGLIVAAGLFFGGYKLALIRQIQPQPTPTPVTVPTPTPDPTANWQTYINDFAKFSIKYPSSMSFSEKSFSEKEKQVVFEGPEGKLIINFAVPESSGWGGGCDPEDRSKIDFLGGVKDVCLTEEWLSQLYGQHPEKHSQVQISANFVNPFSENKEIFLRMLATFRFLEENEDSNLSNFLENWETYTSSTYEIKYPNDFTFRLDEGSTAILQKWGPTQQEGTELYDGISISIQPREISTTLDDLTDSLVKKAIEYQSEIISSPSPITLNGYQGMTFTEKGPGVWENIVLEKGSDSMFAHITVLVSDPGNLGFEKLKDQILSTFRFTN